MGPIDKDTTVRFHHIGYAVADIRAYLDEFVIPLFQPVSVTERVSDPIQKVTVCFVRMAGGTTIELVEPLTEDSPLRSIIGSTRGGMYHTCYEVDDLEAQIRRFRERHCMPLGRPVPAAAFDGRRIVFLLTPQRDLIELLESAREPLTHPVRPEPVEGHATQAVEQSAASVHGSTSSPRTVK